MRGKGRKTGGVGETAQDSLLHHRKDQSADPSRHVRAKSCLGRREVAAAGFQPSGEIMSPRFKRRPCPKRKKQRMTEDTSCSHLVYTSSPRSTHLQRNTYQTNKTNIKTNNKQTSKLEVLLCATILA